MEEEIKKIEDSLKSLKISSDRIKSIEIYWEEIFPNKAFPRIKIELFKNY